METIQFARKAAQTDATTLILEKSGTGKEVCARAIHGPSSRGNQAVIPINRGAIKAALFGKQFLG